MGSLTIRNIPEDVKRRFRQIAAAHGRSMEDHMRRLIVEYSDEVQSHAARVEDKRLSFAHEGAPKAPDRDDDWVSELVRIANGAGEDVFEPEPQPLREFDL